MALNDITMTHSGILTDKATGRNYVLVRFERPAKGAKPKKVIIGEGSVREEKPAGINEIEIKVPSLDVTLNKGFSGEEVEDLRQYLMENSEDIRNKARAISSFFHIFK